MSCNFFIKDIFKPLVAGATVAARLSEVTNWNILVLEAGLDETYASEVPLLFSNLQQSPEDWKFQTEPSPNYCKAMQDGKCNWPRGKALGGSSVINAMMHVRGNRNDYDEWEAFGNPGWGFNETLKYFKKLENVRIAGLKESSLRGTSGPISVEYPREASSMRDLFMESAAELGYLNKENDYNGDSQWGFSLIQNSMRDGLRCSTAKGYLRPVSHKNNIHFSLNSMVEKILIDPVTKTSYGVRFTKNEIAYEVHVSKEVILSAGTIQSPQLLKLSGVGPAAELSKHKIKVIRNAPGCGENLQDHVSCGGNDFLVQNPDKNSDENLSIIMPDIVNISVIKKFLINKNGPLYMSPFSEVMAFINTKYQRSSENRPDIQILMSALTQTADGGQFATKSSGLSEKYYEEVYKEYNFRDAINVYPLLMRPKSRGRILLRDANPYSKPIIIPNYFSHPQDINVLV